MNKIFITLVVFVAFLFIAAHTYATIGVGIGTGKIQVTEKLKAGMIYELPPLAVLNTGDEESGYEVTVQYHEYQKEMRPPREWFMFSPGKFTLASGSARPVRQKINLPIKAEPGDYFAYLEAHPFKTSKQGATTINIAAATKLYFTIVPSSPWQGMYYKVISLWKLYMPYSAIAVGVLLFIIFVLIFRKFVHIDIKLKK